MAERWAADEEAEGRYADMTDTKPRWVEDDLGAIYGPDAPHQERINPADIDPPKSTRQTSPAAREPAQPA